MTTELFAEIQGLMTEGSAEVVKHQSHPLGNGGKIAVYPKTEDEIAKVLSYANENQRTVSVIGGGTKRGFGGMEEAYDILLSLADYRGISEHSSGDMVITVKAGTPFEEIQEYLANFNQRISLDPLWPDKATIGGIIAANDSGPKRLGYGAARDSVIGIRVVYPNGTILNFGGHVAKNVIEFDMDKLYIGSMGTLGVISEITLKLRHIPPCEHLVLLTFHEECFSEIQSVALEILDSVPEPVALELLNPTLTERMIGHSCYTLAISLEDVRSAVQFQEKMVRKIKPPHAGMVIFEKDEAQSFWNTFYRIGPNGDLPQPSLTETVASLKIGVIKMDVLRILQEVDRLKNTYGVHIEAHGGLGTGLCHVYLQGTSEELDRMILMLRRKARELNGYAIVKHLSLSMRQKINVWGEMPPFFLLLDGIKSTVDPNRVLNPKRFIEGI